MKKLLSIFGPFVALLIFSCTDNKHKDDAIVCAPPPKVTAKIEPRVVINSQLDTVFASLIDTAKNYFSYENWGATIYWKDPSEYQRDSVGNRIINLRFSIEGNMRGMSGTAKILVQQASHDTVISQSVTYMNDRTETRVSRVKKGEIVIIYEDIIFSHSKAKEKIISDFIKVFAEQAFAWNGDIFSLKGQMN